MPRYHFHFVSDKRAFPDGDGIELPDLEAARVHARLSIRAVFTGPAERYDWSGWRVSIRDESGSELASVPILEALPQPD
jgi:hypothetical protein